MPKKRSTRSVKRILDILGCDPNECFPDNLKDAKHFYEETNGIIENKHERKLCEVTQKTIYPSKKAVGSAIKNRLNRGSNTDKLRSYQCEHCKNWHMSSSFFT
jgi:hypothetical protein